MNKNQHKRRKANNSKPSTQKELTSFEKALMGFQDYGASVVYVFRTQRIEFTGENPKGVFYIKETKQVTPLSPHVFKNEKGMRRSPGEINSILSQTAHDLGAATFYIQ